MMKRTVPFLITLTVGILLIVAAFIPHPVIGKWKEDFNVFFDIIAAFAFILGGGNLARMHGKKVAERRAGWGYSVVCLIGFFGMLFAGLTKFGIPEGLKGDLNNSAGLFTQIFNDAFRPISSTIFALLAFFIASASYRAFRAKNTEATILLVTAMLILLGRTFIWPLMTDWIPPSIDPINIPNLPNWVMAVPNQAGNRAIQMGVALGIVSLSLKVILGIDRSHLGDKE